jgi:hypothetical protein
VLEAQKRGFHGHLGDGRRVGANSWGAGGRVRLLDVYVNVNVI